MRAARSDPRWPRIVAAGLLLSLWLVPWLGRLRYPLVFGDDVLRLIDVQTLPLGRRLVRPFNEHFAPLFELWTQALWLLAGRRLESVPGVFTAASLVPFALAVVLGFRLLGRAWDDRPAAALAVTLLAATPIHAETVFWFSASSFMAALLFTLLAMGATARADRWGAGFSGVCALAAPLWSGVGLLAGPAAAAVALGVAAPRRWARATAPLVGATLAVGLALLFRHDRAVALSASAYFDPAAGLRRVPEAVGYLVAVGYLGRGIGAELPPWAGWGALAGLVLLSAWAPRDRRGWVAAGWILLLGGYALTYGIRVHVLPGESLVRTTRYHLFPAAGLALGVGAALGSRRAGADLRDAGRTRAGLRPSGPLRMAAVGAIAMALVWVNRPQMRERLNYYPFLGEQAALLRAIDALGDAAESRGLSREEVLDAFEPRRPRWVHPDNNALALLRQTRAGRSPSRRENPPRPVPGASPTLPGGPAFPEPGHAAAPRSSLAEELLAALPERERTRSAQVDLSARLVAVPEGSGRPAEPARLAGVKAVGGRVATPGAPAFVEYRAGSDPPARGLALPGSLAGRGVELWWTDQPGHWSTQRVVVLTLPSAAGAWELPLAAVDDRPVRAFRLVLRQPGAFELDGPRWR